MPTFNAFQLCKHGKKGDSSWRVQGRGLKNSLYSLVYTFPVAGMHVHAGLRLAALVHVYVVTKKATVFVSFHHLCIELCAMTSCRV